MPGDAPLKTASFGGAFLQGVLLFCGFAVIAWMLFWFLAPGKTYEEERAELRESKLAAINADAQKKLYGPPQWIDKDKGTVQLPIDLAMDLVIQDYQHKSIHPSQVKVEVPYPAGLGLGATPAPAPSAKPASSPASSPNAKP
jgi:hypothetical protein